MSQNSTEHNTNSSSSDAPPTKTHNGLLAAIVQTLRSLKNSLWHGSLMHDNSTLEALLRDTRKIVIICLIGWGINYTYTNWTVSDKLVDALSTGCKPSPGLTTDVPFPPIPPLREDAEGREFKRWAMLYIGRLKSSHKRINDDRAAVRRLCG